MRREPITLLRLNLLCAAVLLLLLGAFFEGHSVQSLSGGNIQQVTGTAFNEGATYELFTRHDATLVGPMGAVTARQKDCKT